MVFNLVINNDIVVIIFDDGKVNVVGFDFIQQFNDVLNEVE